jgi:UDP-N-acetylmuramoyl-L-alanyl-D-glutamate--2,6-diaminopimelate ligase
MNPGATLIELVREIPGAVIVRGAENATVADVRHDSRDVEAGDLFVARRGRKADGARFVADALARGAGAIASESDLEGTFALVRVPDAELALGLASSVVWRHPSFSLEVVGITGTNGKTTTAWLVEHALQRLGMHAGLLGTVEHRYGSLRWPALHTTPEADDLARRMAAMRDAGAEHVVMEVSSHAVTLQRVAAVRFRVAALTNVTQDHLDFHGTFDAYADAKRALFLKHGPAVSVLNVDDAVGRDLASRIHGAITYSASGAEGARIRAIRASIDAAGIDAEVATPDGNARLRSPLVGRHNLENLLAALGILVGLDVPAGRAAEALADAVGAPGRLERVRATNSHPAPDVFVDYAHTPDALTNVLRALRPMTRGKLLCVFGCGGDRDPTKRAPMGRAVAQGADVAVLTTDNPRTEDPAAIAAQAEVGLREVGLPRLDALGGERRGYVVELDRRRAIDAAVRAAAAGDVVLVAGKGHEPYQEIHGVRSAFDDREEARRALEGRTG